VVSDILYNHLQVDVSNYAPATGNAYSHLCSFQHFVKCYKTCVRVAKYIDNLY
jgi:hypothetical protein